MLDTRHAGSTEGKKRNIYNMKEEKHAKFRDRSALRGNSILWNSLQEEITRETTPDRFIMKLKMHLFSISC